MAKPNRELRRFMTRRRIHYWMLAKELGMKEIEVIEMLNHELNDTKTQQVNEAIQRLSRRLKQYGY